MSLTTVKFYHERNYLDLLRHPDGQQMWMTQSDLQVVADTYQKTIHTLETNVPRGKLRTEATALEVEGDKVLARGTVQVPNPAMTHVRGYNNEALAQVGDICLINNSSNHLDLLFHKDSMLAKKGHVKYLELNPYFSLPPSQILGEEERNEVNTFKCKFCENTSETKEDLKMHEEQIHPIQTLQGLKIENMNLRKQLDERQSQAFKQPSSMTSKQSDHQDPSSAYTSPQVFSAPHQRNPTKA